MNWQAATAFCVMCYRTAAAQQTARAQVLNSGIIILLIPPILVLGLILWMAFRKRERPDIRGEFDAEPRSQSAAGLIE